MKKDTQTRAAVSTGKVKVTVMPIGDPQDSVKQAQPSRGTDAAPPSITMSARYIDSRLKQFCWR